MTKLLLATAAATLALAGCSYSDTSRGSYSDSSRSDLIDPNLAQKGNGCNFEDSGINCRIPEATKPEIQADSSDNRGN
jgi:hypothetical protein